MLVQPAVAAQRIVVQTSLSDDLPPILGDRIQLQQVVLNLLTNAIEAMHDVANRRRELVISSRREDVGPATGVLVTVEDSGVGFEPVNLSQLFRPCTRRSPTDWAWGFR